LLLLLRVIWSRTTRPLPPGKGLSEAGVCKGEATERPGQAREQRDLHQLHHGKHLSESIRLLHNPSHQTALTESIHHNSLCHAATKAGKTMCSTLRLREGASPTLVAHLDYETGLLRERITLARSVSSSRHPHTSPHPVRITSCLNKALEPLVHLLEHQVHAEKADTVLERFSASPHEFLRPLLPLLPKESAGPSKTYANHGVVKTSPLQLPRPDHAERTDRAQIDRKRQGQKTTRRGCRQGGKSRKRTDREP